MLAKISLVLTLIVSLLFATQAQPMAVPVEMKAGGMCAGMQCVRGCCANVACCTFSERKQAPLAPASDSQRFHVQLPAVVLRSYFVLFTPPARERPLALLDDAGSAHTLPPLTVGCIQLI